jgi:hypothetical protein
MDAGCFKVVSHQFSRGEGRAIEVQERRCLCGGMYLESLHIQSVTMYVLKG